MTPRTPRVNPFTASLKASMRANMDALKNAEIARLTRERDEFEQSADHYAGECERVQARLNEAVALLRRAPKYWPNDLAVETRAFLARLDGGR